MFVPRISVENDSFILKVIMPGDAAATLEYLRLNEYGLHLNALRRLPLLWYHALHDVGGMQPQRLVEMMTFVAAFYEDWPLPQRASLRSTVSCRRHVGVSERDGNSLT